MKIIKQGAEAIIYLDNNKIIKDRIEKDYRVKEIDLKLRKTRTKKELKLLEKLSFTPKVIFYKDNKIEMEFIDGHLIKDVLENSPKFDLICKLIGKQIKEMHDKNIIHGDLTTSNMILRDNKLYFIDFGLGFVSNRIEDKAVDLHLLKQALESKHYRIFDKAFYLILKSYNPNKELIKRIEKIEKRGRYKG